MGAFFQPTDISGCFSWFRASDIGWGNAASGIIYYWPDMSGSGNNLTPGNSSLAPYYYSNVVNGYPVARFNGNQYIQTSGVTGPFAALGINQLTGFCVYNTTSYTSNQVIYANDHSFGTASNSSFIIGINNSSNSSCWYGTGKSSPGPPNQFNSAANVVGANVWILRSDVFAQGTTTLSMKRNGASISTQATAVPIINASNFFQIGHSSAFNVSLTGDVAEVICYNRHLASGEIIQIEDYLKNKYNIDGSRGTTLFMYGEVDPTGFFYQNFPLSISGGALSVNNNTTLYTGSSSSSSSGTSLFLGPSTTMSSGKTLFLNSSTAISSGMSLYIGASTTQSSGISLWTGAPTLISSGLSLFMNGVLGSNNNASLYIGASSTGTANIPLFIGSATSISGFFPLFIGSSTTISSGMSLFVGSTTTISGGNTLWIGASSISSGTTPLWMNGIPPIFSGGINLWVGAASSGYDSPTLWIGASDVSSSGMSLNTYGAFFGSGATTLYTQGALESRSSTLFVDGGGYVSGNMTLWTAAPVSGTNTMSMYIGGKLMVTRPIYMYIKQIPYPTGTSHIPLYINTPTVANASGFYANTNLFISSFGVGNSMPLFLNNTDTGSGYGSIPLYLHNPIPPNSGINYSVPLFITNNTLSSGKRVKMFIRGDGVMDGASVSGGGMNLFIKQNTGNFGSVNLFIATKDSGTLSSPLYMKGVFNYSSGQSLYISGGGNSGSIPLYVSAGGSINSGIGLYTYGQPLINNSINTYVYGF